MNEPLKILIAGGDLRQLYCAERLSRDNITAITGFDEYNTPVRTPIPGELFDCAVLPVPPLENGMVYTPFSQKKIAPSAVKEMLKSGGIVLAGRVDDELKKNMGTEVIDYLESEELSLKNAVPTAEGAVQLALEELPVTLNGLKVLIVGPGRIGTALAEILKGFGADITAAVHNERGAAKARIIGIRSSFTEDISTDFGLVFNTVPKMIFTREILKKFSRETLFIDLASKPGGIDHDAASDLGIKVICAPGLPGKTAPVTAGEIIAETVMSILKGGTVYDGTP